ncbi:MAG TPA: hypothetical protein VNT30_07740 [Stellaceae bacterium]|nr:hypothetical protein [Stellaceae bacterium]
MVKHQAILIGCMIWLFLGATALLTLTIACATSAPTLVTFAVCDAVGAVSFGIIVLAHIAGGLALLPSPTGFTIEQRIRVPTER